MKSWFLFAIGLTLLRLSIQKKILYLVHHDEYVDLSQLSTLLSDYILLVSKDPLNILDRYPNVIFFPNSTTLHQRNRLYAEIKLRYPQAGFVYLVFLDGSKIGLFEESLDYGMNTGDRWRTLEHYLLENEPALASPRAFDCPTIVNRKLNHSHYPAPHNNPEAKCEHRHAVDSPLRAEVEVAFDHDNAGVMALHFQASRALTG